MKVASQAGAIAATAVHRLQESLSLAPSDVVYALACLLRGRAKPTAPLRRTLAMGKLKQTLPIWLTGDASTGQTESCALVVGRARGNHTGRVHLRLIAHHVVMHRHFRPTHAEALGFLQGLLVVPPIMRDSIAGHHGPGAVGAAAAVHEHRPGGSVVEQSQHLG